MQKKTQLVWVGVLDEITTIANKSVAWAALTPGNDPVADGCEPGQ